MLRDQEGMNIVHLQLIYTLIKIEGIKEFYRDFISDDIRL
jgi:hypothetical protein